MFCAVYGPYRSIKQHHSGAVGRDLGKDLGKEFLAPLFPK